MSPFSMLRRPTYSALSFAVRAVGSGRTFHRVISTIPTFTPSLIRRSFVPTQRFSTAAAAVEPIGDQSLVAVLDTEIKCAEEHKAPTPERPDEFPFEIVDNSGDNTILLKREFDGETIQLCVDIPNCSMPGDPDDVDDDLKYNDPGIPIVVSISKPNGQQLEFGVTGFATELSIDTLSIKHPGDPSEDIAYDGPEFDDLDENLQIAFYKYLNERGIKDDMVDFLYDYLENKENKEYRMWLKNLKSFVEH